MNIFDQFLTLPIVIFCLVICFLVWLQKTGLEMAFPKLKNMKIWNDFLVHIGPCGTGGIIAASVKAYPFPAILDTNWFNRACVGIVCGVFSAYVWRMAKSFLVQKAGITITTTVDDQPEVLK